MISLVIGMTQRDIGGRAIHTLEYTDVRHLGPVFHGDTIYAESTIISAEEGIVTVDVKPMIVHGDVRIDPGLVLRRGGTHISRADRESGRHAKDNECGSNMKRHGQNTSP